MDSHLLQSDRVWHVSQKEKPISHGSASQVRRPKRRGPRSRARMAAGSERSSKHCRWLVGDFSPLVFAKNRQRSCGGRRTRSVELLWVECAVQSYAFGVGGGSGWQLWAKEHPPADQTDLLVKQLVLGCAGIREGTPVRCRSRRSCPNCTDLQIGMRPCWEVCPCGHGLNLQSPRMETFCGFAPV